MGEVGDTCVGGNGLMKLGPNRLPNGVHAHVLIALIELREALHHTRRETLSTATGLRKWCTRYAVSI